LIACMHKVFEHACPVAGDMADLEIVLRQSDSKHLDPAPEMQEPPNSPKTPNVVLFRCLRLIRWSRVLAPCPLTRAGDATSDDRQSRRPARSASAPWSRRPAPGPRTWLQPYPDHRR